MAFGESDLALYTEQALLVLQLASVDSAPEVGAKTTTHNPQVRHVCTHKTCINFCLSQAAFHLRVSESSCSLVFVALQCNE